MKKTFFAILFVLFLVLSGCLASLSSEEVALQAVNEELQQEWNNSSYFDCFFDQTILFSESSEDLSSFEIIVCFNDESLVQCRDEGFIASYIVVVDVNGNVSNLSEKMSSKNPRPILCGDDTVFW